MGKLTDIPEVEFVIKIFLIMYLTVRLIVLVCLLPFAYVYHTTRKAVTKGFSWSTTEP